LSELSPSSTSPPTPSPLPALLSEPHYVKSVPIESLGAKLAPRHHLARPLTIGWPELAGEPSAGGEVDRSPVLVGWAERLQSTGPFQLGGLSALWTEPDCTVLFIIFHPDFSNLFNSNSNLV
jgi:hypothetical protein